MRSSPSRNISEVAHTLPLIRKALMVLYLSLSLTVAAQNGRDEPKAPTKPWEVNIELNPRYPKGLHNDLRIQVLNPSSDKVQLKGSLPYLSVTPIGDFPRPTHVLLELSGALMRTITLDTGVLDYFENPYLMFVSSTLAPDLSRAFGDPPNIESAIRLRNDATLNPVFQITVFNPKDSELNLESLTLTEYVRSNHGCPTGPGFEPPVWKLDLAVDGKRLVGELKMEGSAQPFSYHMAGTFLADGCGGFSITAHAPFAFPVPARQHAYLDFEVNQANYEEICKAISEGQLGAGHLFSVRGSVPFWEVTFGLGEGADLSAFIDDKTK